MYEFANHMENIFIKYFHILPFNIFIFERGEHIDKNLI